MNQRFHKSNFTMQFYIIQTKRSNGELASIILNVIGKNLVTGFFLIIIMSIYKIQIIILLCFTHTPKKEKKSSFFKI